MPGVQTIVGAVAGPNALTRAPSAQYFAVGTAERGPVDRAVTVLSVLDLEREFGTATTYSALHSDLQTFFQEGGGKATVVRVVGPNATTGALATPLLDDSGDDAQPTLSVKAANPGQWSGSIAVQVLPGAIKDTKRIQIRYGGTPNFPGAIVEDFNNLRDPMLAAQEVNARSKYIRLQSLGSTSDYPENLPAVLDAPVTLAAGTDDRASIVAAHYGAALDMFPKGLGDGAVAIPGGGPAVHKFLLNHAAENNRLAMLAGEKGADIGTLISLVSAVAGSIGAERAGLFAPWVRIPDAYGATKAISPEGYAAAKRARAHDQSGPWQPGAGEIGKAAFVSGPDQLFTPAQVDLLNASQVNPIAVLSGATRLYGWRSTSADKNNWLLLSGADTLNRIITQADAQLEPYVFGVIDSKGHLLQSIAGVLEGIVKPIAEAGGLFDSKDSNGALIDPGYKIDTLSSNTPLDVEANTVHAYLAVRIVPAAELIRLTITKTGVTAPM